MLTGVEIALAGAIGTGLFLSLGTALSTGGPLGALLGYAFVGAVVCSVMYALGEVCIGVTYSLRICVVLNVELYRSQHCIHKQELSSVMQRFLLILLLDLPLVGTWFTLLSLESRPKLQPQSS